MSRRFTQQTHRLLLSPYEQTLYLDSDVVACPGFDESALWSAVGDADVGGITARGRAVNGGVLAYRSSAADMLREWERRYLMVMHETRREQPVLQQALAWARENLTGFAYAELSRQWNCRGETQCANGCFLLHDHDAFLAVSPLPKIALPDADEVALQAAYTRACPNLSAGHPVVVLASPLTRTDVFWTFLETGLGELRKDNDAEACRVDSDDVSHGIASCVAGRLRYGVIATVNGRRSWAPIRPPPGLPAATPVAIAWLRHPVHYAMLHIDVLADCLPDAQDCPRITARYVSWFAMRNTRDLDRAMFCAKTYFAVVLIAERPFDSYTLLESILPSHFLGLSGQEHIHSIPATSPVKLAAALALRMPRDHHVGADLQSFIGAVLDLDTRLYTYLNDEFKRRIHACGVQQRATNNSTNPLFFLRRRRQPARKHKRHLPSSRQRLRSPERQRL